MKEELRPCVVKTEGEAIKTRSIYGKQHTKVIEEPKTHKGYFHTWAYDSYVTNSYLVGTAAGFLWRCGI